MAVNTYTNLDVDKITSTILRAFHSEYPLLSRIVTRVNSEPIEEGDTMQIRTVPAGGAAEDYSTTHKYNMSAYTNQGKTVVGHDIVANKRLIAGIFSESTKRGTSVPMQEWTDSVVEQLGKGILQWNLADITNANYGAAIKDIVASDMSLNIIRDTAVAMDNAKIREKDRFLCLPRSYFTHLATVAEVRDMSASGIPQALAEGQVTRLLGMELIPCDDIPGNSENLVGFAGTKKALILGSAPLIYEDHADGLAAQAPEVNRWLPMVTDEDGGVGVGLNYYAWRESGGKTTHHTWEFFGGKLALKTAQFGAHPLFRIVDTA